MAEERSGTDGKPKLLSGVNGVIAGLTGLIVAVGGLFTAYNAMNKDRDNSTAQQAAAALPASVAAKPEEPARPTHYSGDLYEDGEFDGGTVQLEQDGDKWIVNEGGDKYEYDEVASRDKSHIVASSPSYTSTLRWSVNGGIVEQSTTEQRDKWETYARVKVIK